ncbi:polyphosphate kinase 2 family protein [Sphingobacterium alkalisoli]|uniref:Polyphosphate kinase 2 family protein n=1 Tax=Sphingobacterium alkalisoli TaxID=1874115 RepID=A0A4U0GUC0_9SPHI|nr:PPK2 family polyphosphate kinase [Sphingobacterium alkalisoli]TJY62665.1 polyphosphate kinase 2 family protein [Sphingobacterium alkalisoli]GGH28094.1 polyphosphate kinase [Sphingobacterium alkalisoli]
MSGLKRQLKADSKFKMENYPTDISDSITPEDAKKELKRLRKELAQLQDVMYAHDRYSVLICLQGMDTAGKDSLIREVFEKFNARGVIVSSFKTPSSKELQHDYLWRHVIALPEKGKFGVFNRTHYENVLVTRVHPEYLLRENLPEIKTTEDLPKDFWRKRYEQINNFEEHISANGTIIFKFYLHLSKGEQRKRLLRRLEKEDHNWKFSPGDLEERKLWDKYMESYQEAIQHTSKSNAPWYIIPADNKEISRYLVVKTVLEELKKYKDIQYPELPEDIEKHIHIYKKQLESEK